MNPLPILPGAAIGVLGSGQLGRMFSIAARRLGYRVHVLSPDDDDTPAGALADVEIKASYDDLERVARFAANVQVVTFEFENVPAATTETAARFAPVRPAGSALHTTQNRLREKTFLQQAGLPVTPFHPVRTEADLQAALAHCGLPAVLKTADWGYDGKGQQKIAAAEQAAGAWLALGRREAVLEAFVDFELELSVVAARGMDGKVVCFPPFANTHRNHILDVSSTPAPLSERTESEAVEIARSVVEELGIVGVLCVEFFLTRDRRLRINELAPRPHNSGHLTIDAHETCQFEQQVRAICGLPLGSPRLRQPAAMANLMGELWARGEPNWPAVCALPGLKLHLYGKRTPRPGRKMGHITALADDPLQAIARVTHARALLAHRAEMAGAAIVEQVS